MNTQHADNLRGDSAEVVMASATTGPRAHARMHADFGVLPLRNAHPPSQFSASFAHAGS